MKENIPTVKQVIGEGESSIELELYEWLTQEEEDNYLTIILRGTSLKDARNEEIWQQLFDTKSVESVGKERDFLITSLIKNYSLEQINSMKPSIRKQVFVFIDNYYSELKKK